MRTIAIVLILVALAASQPTQVLCALLAAFTTLAQLLGGGASWTIF